MTLLAFMALFAAYSGVFLCTFRLFAGNVVGTIRSEFGAPLYVMVVGIGERARRLGAALEGSSKYGVRLVGFLAGDPVEAPAEVKLEGVYKVYPLGELPRLLREHVIDEILFAVDSRQLAELEDVFLLCDEEGVRTRVAADFFPHVNSTVYLERLGHTPLLTFAAGPHDEIRLMVIKRDGSRVPAVIVIVWYWRISADDAPTSAFIAPGSTTHCPWLYNAS